MIIKTTNKTIEKMIGNLEDAITGCAFTGEKLPTETRLTKIAKSTFNSIPEIYQVGQWFFSLSGLLVCILTSKIAADHITKRLGKINGEK